MADYNPKDIFLPQQCPAAILHYYGALFSIFSDKGDEKGADFKNLQEGLHSDFSKFYSKNKDPKLEGTQNNSNGSTNISKEDLISTYASHTALHLYSLKLNAILYNKPHYRTGTYQEDLKANLSNVAVPGTSIPLSVFCLFSTKVFYYLFIFLVYPILCVLTGICNEFSRVFLILVKIRDEYNNVKKLASKKQTKNSTEGSAFVGGKNHNIQNILGEYLGLETAFEGYFGDFLTLEKVKTGKNEETIAFTKLPPLEIAKNTMKLFLFIFLEIIKNTAVQFQQHLLLPNSWFFYWRLNCVLATYSANSQNVTSATKESGFSMENKWDFLVKCDELDVPCTPCFGLGKLKQLGNFSDSGVLVAKDKNCEGGMGIQFLTSASSGGDWILQPKLDNADCLKRLLPENAPFSTFRVLTSSDTALKTEGENKTSNTSEIKPLTCVFRAGRKNAKTDHAAVFYNVDIGNPNITDSKSSSFGKITRGSINAHWYHTSLKKCLDFKKEGCWTNNGVFAKGFESQNKLESHPDSGMKLVGESFDNSGAIVNKILDICIQAHAKTCPDVPFAGWDVGVIDEDKEPVPVLVETNLSCNFFLGDFDRTSYFEYCEKLVNSIEKNSGSDAKRSSNKTENKKKK